MGRESIQNPIGGVGIKDIGYILMSIVFTIVTLGVIVALFVLGSLHIAE